MELDHKPTVLIVDDAPDNLMLIKMLLQGRYRVKLALNGEIALRAAEQLPVPDLILLDVIMPEMDGYAVCRQLKAKALTADIPVIFLTSRNHLEDQRRGFREGAVDYITKPIDPDVLQARVSTHLQLKALRTLLKEQNLQVDHLVEERTRDLMRIQDATILAVASLAESGDNETRNHLRRTQHYLAALARQLQMLPQFADELSEENIAMMFKAAPLHDIGKVRGSDPSVRNPGKLNEEEFFAMQQHTVFGRDSIVEIEKYLGAKNSFLRYAREICYSHQEKFDGTGYPEGLIGTAIPLSARLMAVADVYDALISRRSYKEEVSHKEAIKIIAQARAKHFDPDIVDALLAIEDQIEAIAAQYHDA